MSDSEMQVDFIDIDNTQSGNNFSDEFMNFDNEFNNLNEELFPTDFIPPAGPDSLSDNVVSPQNVEFFDSNDSSSSPLSFAPSPPMKMETDVPGEMPMFNAEVVPAEMDTFSYSGVSGSASIPIEEGSTMNSPAHTSNDEEEANNPKAKRKRRKKAPVVEQFHPADSNSVALSRDELLKITSDQYDQFAKQMETTRELTEAEKKKLKDQRRLIKNRESAFASRARKKGMMEEMESRISQLNAEKQHLQDRLNAMLIENKQLRAENLELRSKSSGSAAQTHPQTNSVFNVARPSNTKQAGAMLFLVLFAFGLFMNLDQKPLNAAHQKTARHLIDKAYSSLEITDPVSTSRHILATDDSPLKRVVNTTPSTITEANISPKSSKDIVVVTDETDGADSAQVKRQKLQYYRQKQYQKQQEQQRRDAEAQSLPGNSTHKQALQHWVSDQKLRTTARRNTAYLTCNDLQQVVTPDQMRLNPDDPFFISFLVPARSLSKQGGAIPIVDNTTAVPEDALFEIATQVVDVSLVYPKSRPLPMK